MRRLLVIDGHPDPAPHFIHALADAYARGAKAGGHALRRVDVARLDFPILRAPASFADKNPPPDIAAAQNDVLWAEHIVLLFPLWLGDMPALLKGFFEQLARPDFAFRERPEGFPEKLLRGRSAHIYVTMGMPAIAYRLWYGAPGLKALERNVLRFTGIAPVRSDLIGMVEHPRFAHREAWLERLEAAGRAGR